MIEAGPAQTEGYHFTPRGFPSILPHHLVPDFKGAPRPHHQDYMLHPTAPKSPAAQTTFCAEKAQLQQELKAAFSDLIALSTKEIKAAIAERFDRLEEIRLQ